MSPRTPWPAAVAAAILLCPAGASAWSAHGHEMVGRIAQDLLTQQAQAGDAQSQATLTALAQLLGQGYDLSQLAPCADRIKRAKDQSGKPEAGPDGLVSCGGLELPIEPQSAAWHFIDIPISDSPQTASDLEQYCPNGACVVDQIRDDEQTLSSSDAAKTDKQVALMFLVHLVGDEHQPLHCATEIANGVNDYGGNAKAITFGPDFPLTDADRAALDADARKNIKPELHALWDQVIEATDDLPVDALSQTLEAAIQGESPDALNAWVTGDFVAQAALESFAIAQNQIYPAYYQDGPVITADYQNRMQPIAETRIEMAGYRLMTLLKQALGQPAASPAVAQASALGTAAPDRAQQVQKSILDFQTSTGQ